MFCKVRYLLLAAACGGCSGLLPRSEVATQETWRDYDAAQAAIERIEPMRSRRADLAAEGIDPQRLCDPCAALEQQAHRQFWLDSFSFKRETDMTGWRFNALVLFVGDLVVYTLHGGQPRVHEKEVTRNPLGPLQGWGQQVTPGLID
jgi:hypothetical protein